jgi:TPR repeat protein
LFGATLVVARRVHNGVAPAPVPAPVAEVADSPVAGAPPDIGPSPGAGSVSEEAAVAGLALDRVWYEEGSEAYYADSVGVSLRPGQTFAEYIADLDTRITHGDTAAMLKMAQILKNCWYAHAIAENAVEVAVTHKREVGKYYDRELLQDRLCDSTLALSDYAQVRNQQAELIVEAARRGDEAAILAQFQNFPHWVESDTLSESSQEWVNAAAGRLQALAGTGNAKAALALGKLYSSGSFTPKDFAKAAPYFRQVLDSAPMSKEEALRRSLMAIRTGSDDPYLEIFFSTVDAEGTLRMICGKIPPGSVTPGVCK